MMTRVLTSTVLACLAFFCVGALQAVFARELKIMGTSSLTGKHSGAGIECKRAIEMWVENVNSRGGVEIKVAGGSSESKKCTHCTHWARAEQHKLKTTHHENFTQPSSDSST